MRRERADGCRPTRRRVLAGVSAAVTGALAGCSAVFDGDEPTADDEGYEHLRRTAVYVDDDVDLSLPEAVETVGATNNADLLVLPGDTGVGAGQAVDWLADERVVALLGDDAEETWLAWARSDAYRDAFGGDGVSDGDPDPDLLVAAAVGLQVPTYRYTWGSGPSDRDVLRKLDEALADVDSRTPR